MVGDNRSYEKYLTITGLWSLKLIEVNIWYTNNLQPVTDDVPKLEQNINWRNFLYLLKVLMLKLIPRH